VLVDDVPDGFQGAFMTPSGNVRCEVFGGYASCDVVEHTWGAQRSPQDPCDGPTHSAVVLGVSRQTAFSEEQCGEVRERQPVLAYGHGVEVGSLRCLSLEDGLECHLLGTRDGFKVSRTRLTYGVRAQDSPAAVVRTDPSHPVVPVGFWGNVRTPSRNIYCLVSDELASCWSGEPPYERPAGEDCAGEGDPVVTIDVGTSGKGDLAADCWSDFPYYADLAQAYGTDVTVGRMRCASERTGMTCTNTSTRHGFFVSKASYRLF
jgi:hypothetical protein